MDVDTPSGEVFGSVRYMPMRIVVVVVASDMI